MPREANKISIPIFKNNTKIHYLAEKLTARLKEEINMDGRLAVVNNNARLLLNGILIQYQLQPIIFDNFGEPVQKRLRILASIQLFDLKKKKEIFFERSIQSFEEFSEIVPPIKTELQTREKILRILAKRIAKKVIKGWYTGLMTPVEKGK